jgi:hypothetical protein
MRSLLVKIPLACLFLYLTGHACADEARTALEKAIQAHGGADKLERTKRGRLKASVNGRRFGGVLQWAWEETFDLPRRYRQIAEGTVGGRAFFADRVLDGTRGWIRLGRSPATNFEVEKPDPLESHWHAILAQLLLFERDKDTELKWLGEQMKDDRRLVVISAHSPRARADLYFDRTTGLLARAVQPLPNLMAGKGKAVIIGESVYDDYKNIQGIQYPMHSKATNPDSTLDIKIASIEFLDKIDDLAFAKPVEVAPADAEAPSPSQPAAPASADTPARWELRLVVATLAGGAFVAVVWMLVRNSKARKQETPR